MTAGKPVSTVAQQRMAEGQQRRRLAERGANIPKKAGHYWAQWRIADDGTPEGDEQTPSTTWEVVHVFENCNDTDNPEWLRVEVPGQPKSQSLENFFWGPGPLSLARAYYTPETELQFRYEVREALGWNDKTSLDILVNGVRNLKRAHDKLLADRDEQDLALRDALRETASCADELAFWKFQAIYHRALMLRGKPLSGGVLMLEGSRVWREAEKQLEEHRAEENRARTTHAEPPRDPAGT